MYRNEGCGYRNEVAGVETRNAGIDTGRDIMGNVSLIILSDCTYELYLYFDKNKRNNG